MEEDERARAALARGEPGAFEKLIDEFGPRLLRAATMLLGEPSSAEDVVQDVLVSLVRSRERLWHVENLSAYLFASLRRAALRRIESRRREHRSIQGWSAIQDHAARRPASNDSEQRLGELVGQLPADQREVLVLHLDGELTFREISELLGISQNTVASRYRYAIANLRDGMKGGRYES